MFSFRQTQRYNGKAGSASEADVHFCDLGLGSGDKHLENPLAGGYRHVVRGGIKGDPVQGNGTVDIDVYGRGIWTGVDDANPSARRLTKSQSGKQ